MLEIAAGGKFAELKYKPENNILKNINQFLAPRRRYTHRLSSLFTKNLYYFIE